MDDRTTEVRLPRSLGDGLRLRRATAADAEALAAFNGRVHAHGGWDPAAAVWTRDLLRGDHPTLTGGGVLLVEETASGAIVSSACLIPQTWSYGGIAFGVGRPELIGTDPAFRHRGLVRAQMEVLHAWSAARGDLLQAITGIPHFYRRFGYEPALITGGARAGYRPHLPPLADGTTEPYRLRPAADADLPFAIRLLDQANARSLVACVRDEALLRYEWSGRDPGSDFIQAVRIVETAAGEAVGLLVHRNVLDGPALWVIAYDLVPDRSWLAVTPSVVRALWATGQEYAARDGGACDAFVFATGADHPVTQVIPDRLPRRLPPFTFHIRIPDLPGFVRHLAPTLERRLAASPLVGHTGELRLGFYEDGLRLAFADGRLDLAERWRPTPGDARDADFPGLTFLQLLLGSRSLAELEHAFPTDCWVYSDEGRALLPILFPRQPSAVWPVG